MVEFRDINFGESPLLLELRRTTETIAEQKKREQDAAKAKAEAHYRKEFAKKADRMIAELPDVMRGVAAIGKNRCTLVDWSEYDLIVAKDCYLELYERVKREFPGFRVFIDVSDLPVGHGSSQTVRRNVMFIEW